MTKKPKIIKSEQRKEIVTRYVGRRAGLKCIIKSPRSADEEHMDIQYELDRQPHGASPIRIHNHDATGGRPHGYLHKFGLSRIRVRETVHRGEPPGVRKSNW